MNTSSEALGLAIRKLRLEKGLTQSTLGSDAGYHGGAGVTISRVESGQLEPSPERLEGIASALGVTVSSLHDLASSQETLTGRGTGGSKANIDERLAQLKALDERRAELSATLELFTEARDQANESFLAPFREFAARVTDIDVPPLTATETRTGDDDDDPKAVVSSQLFVTTQGVKEALAGSGRSTAESDSEFESFTAMVAAAGAAAAFAIATSGTNTGSWNLNTALRVASLGSPKFLAKALAPTFGGIALAALAAFAALAGESSVRRNKKQLAAVEAELARVEREVARSQPAVEAALAVLHSATETLAYVAVHAGHALSRWRITQMPGRISWESFSDADRARYEQFTEVVAAQLAIASIDIKGLIESRGAELEQARDVAQEILAQSSRTITNHV